MSIDNLIKRLQNIMRQDAGIDGDAQRIGQIVWILFLKVYDTKEKLWELNDDYVSIIPEELRWRNWAAYNKDDEAMTGDTLLDFVNEQLFPALKSLEVYETTEKRSAIVKNVFEGAYNYMKNGFLLRKVINAIDEIDFTEYEERHAFNDIYERIIKDLQSAGKSGEFYTPRAVTDFIAEVLNPQIGEKIADFACGTGGFLTSALRILEKQIKTPQDRELVQKNIYGIEKKSLPHLLCMTNLLLHDIDEPSIEHKNSLEENIIDYKEEDKVDVIIMNPPYGGTEEDTIKINFPVEMQSSETADLFIALILYRLKEKGRAGVVLPDNFLFSDDITSLNIKRKLIEECNLHTIVRLPKGVFAPYTDIPTNLVFFTKTGSTNEVWYYEHKLPEGYKIYSKTKPINKEEFGPELKWWNERVENEYAWKVPLRQIIENNYNLDIKNPESNINTYSQISNDMICERFDKSSTSIMNYLEKIRTELTELTKSKSETDCNTYKIGDLLTRVKEAVNIEDENYYSRVTIKTNNQGIRLRDTKKGREIGTKRQFRVRKGQFLLSKIDARNGAFGIVPEELDKAIITANFWTYEVNHKLLDIEWFNLYVSLPEFIEICEKTSSGSTNRKYLKEKRFLDFQILLPSLEEQNEMIGKYNRIRESMERAMSELQDSKELILTNLLSSFK